MLRLSFITIIIFSLYACEQRREFDIDEFEKEVVVNAIISTDSSWNVSLSYTKSIFDASAFEQINDAEVRIKDLSNGQSFFLDRKKTGNYTRELNPVEGHDYEINVNIPNRPEIHAITYVPSVLEVDVVSTLVVNESGNESIEIDIAIIDNPDEENFYVWELLKVNPDDYHLTAASPVSTQIENAGGVDPNNSTDNQGNSNNQPLNSGLLSPDDIFSFNTAEDESIYQNKKLNDPSFFSETDIKEGRIANKLILDASLISTINENYQVGGNEDTEGKTPLFELKVMAVSSDLYEYLKTYEYYKRNELINSSFADPIIIHSNIGNGLGIFGGYNLKSFYIY